LESSTAELILSLKHDHPGVPFLALGQTALWDEAVKAAWRLLLDKHYPDAHLTAGVHDTDYFAKTTALVHDDSPYVALQHDDILTQGLWSAAGELSALFGSEDVPTRHAFQQHSVPIDRIAEFQAHDKPAFLSQKTAAWGWRGIVDTRPRQRIAHDVRLDEIRPALDSQMRWGFDVSLALIAPEHRESARRTSELITSWISEIASQTAECRLSDLYEQLLPRFYALLLGRRPANFDTTRSTRLFRFNSATCHLPRFQFVSHFLNPATSTRSRSAYDTAVAGGGMYSLAEFGPGALPFDVVVPGVGRGTLHVSTTGIRVDLPAGNDFETERRAEDLSALANILEERFGPDVVLVGKAVTLPSMLAAEFLTVFHETASGYTDRTTAMNDAMRSGGIRLDLNPIVRLQYPTWDAIGVLGSSLAFELPPHLAQAFGKDRIAADEFSSRWRNVTSEQRDKLASIRGIRTTRSLLEFLESSGDRGRCWRCLLDVYSRLQNELRDGAAELAPLRTYIANLKTERRTLRRRLNQLQIESGRHFRAAIQPLRIELDACSDPARTVELRAALEREEELRENHFETEIDRAFTQIRHWGRVMQRLRVELRLAERSPGLANARSEAYRIAMDAELARLEQVRSALLTTASLPHTHSRPSAWWLPLADQSGAWFGAIAAGATARLERL
jgi:hypothetical protein